MQPAEYVRATTDKLLLHTYIVRSATAFVVPFILHTIELSLLEEKKKKKKENWPFLFIREQVKKKPR